MHVMEYSRQLLVFVNLRKRDYMEMFIELFEEKKDHQVHQQQLQKGRNFWCFF